MATLLHWILEIALECYLAWQHYCISATVFGNCTGMFQWHVYANFRFLSQQLSTRAVMIEIFGFPY